ncbi:MAG: DNA cytosine methyltransferase [Candidatus Methanofishera endochildressiae]|uniref:DNA cytosine methyltransferase n=1 Tax=Candidatus Methanofishera endochildressiae TaxID=2738884 RepID=A0A7Z0MP17_9GAMM|nr:DNA cytosine methyltransferase [Candidatus Methanofishera endochildressiae]
MMEETYPLAQVADILSIPKAILHKWEKNGKLIPSLNSRTGEKEYTKTQLEVFEPARAMYNTQWDKEQKISPVKTYNGIELFAGAGGLALGLEKAGMHSLMLNEIDKQA